MSKHLLFVYGTLRRGGVRAMPELFPGAKFVGGGNVRGSLYDLGEHPGLLLDESGPTVVGEVYEVDDEILRALDEVEASSDYGRRRAEVSLGGRGAACWVYAPDAKIYPRQALISSGDWIEHAKAKAGGPRAAEQQMKTSGNDGEHGPAVSVCLEEQGALVRGGGYWNCLAAARELAALLLAEGRSPWIARLRKTGERDGQAFHWPLTPRVPGVAATWTTHYVCCCDATAYDPVAGRAVRLEAYSEEVFGERIPLEVFVPAAELPAYLATGRQA